MSNIINSNSPINYTDFSNTKIRDLCQTRLSCLINSAANYYRFIDDESNYKNAIYRANDRLYFAIAHDVLNVTRKEFTSSKKSLDELVEVKNRKKLIKIHKYLSNISDFETFRSYWNLNLKSIYSLQKRLFLEQKSFLNACAVCFINDRYLSLCFEKPILTTNMSLATEFPILSLNDSEFDRIQNIVLNLVNDDIEIKKIKIVFQSKHSCRHIYMN